MSNNAMNTHQDNQKNATDNDDDVSQHQEETETRHTLPKMMIPHWKHAANRHSSTTRLASSDAEIPPRIGAIRVRNPLASSSSSSSSLLNDNANDLEEGHSGNNIDNNNNMAAAETRSVTSEHTVDLDTFVAAVTNARLVDEDQEKMIRRLEQRQQAQEAEIQVLRDQQQQRQHEKPATTEAFVDVAIATEIMSPPSLPPLQADGQRRKAHSCFCCCGRRGVFLSLLCLLFLLGVIALIVVVLNGGDNEHATPTPSTFSAPTLEPTHGPVPSSSQAPITHGPTTPAPPTLGPSTFAPTENTPVPTTLVPSTEVPTTEVPSTAAPTLQPTTAPTPVPVVVSAPVSFYIHETQEQLDPGAGGFYLDPSSDNLIDGVAGILDSGTVSAWIPHGDDGGSDERTEEGRITFYFDQAVTISAIRLFFVSHYCWGLDTPQRVEVEVGDATYTLSTEYRGQATTPVTLNHALDFRFQKGITFSRASVSTLTLRVFCGNAPPREEPGRCGASATYVKCGLSEVQFFQLLT